MLGRYQVSTSNNVEALKAGDVDLYNATAVGKLGECSEEYFLSVIGKAVL